MDSWGDTIWLTCQGNMLVQLALFNVEWFFHKGKGILKIELQNYMAEKERWESPTQEYMHDIQVIHVLLVNEVFLGFLIPDWLVWIVIHSNTIEEVQCPKITSNRCEIDHDKNENKVLLCSPSHRNEPSSFILRT